MIIGMPSIGHFSIIQTYIHGSLIFMTPVQIHFQFGSIIGGCGLAVPPMFYLLMPKMVGTSRSNPQQQ